MDKDCIVTGRKQMRIHMALVHLRKRIHACIEPGTVHSGGVIVDLFIVDYMQRSSRKVFLGGRLVISR